MTGRTANPNPYRVDPETGCWIWTQHIDASGYGHAWANGRTQKAHRVMYERTHGPIPAGLELDHLCRNRACVNPEHLEPVSKAINVQRGALAKLTADLVAELRATYAAGGVTQKQLAAKYGVSWHTVNEIVRGKTWRVDSIAARSA